MPAVPGRFSERGPGPFARTYVLPCTVVAGAGLAGPLALAVGGVLLFLAENPLPFALAGPATLGCGMGMRLPHTLSMGRWLLIWDPRRWIARTVHLSLTATLLVAWVIGTFASFAGPASLRLAVLITLVCDHPFSGDRAVV